MYNVLGAPLHYQLPWGFREEGEGARVGGTVERIGDSQGRAEEGGKTTETHLRDHIRGETFVQKDLVYGVGHACTTQALKPVWVAYHSPCESEHWRMHQTKSARSEDRKPKQNVQAEGRGKVNRC